MVAAIMMAEYELQGVAVLDDELAELRFDALAYPYGGIGALIRLVQSFGFDVVGFDDGLGYRED
jgi:hypothetical protein